MIQNLLDFSGRRRLSSIQQTEAAECGIACLAMVAAYHGHRIDLNTLRRRYPVSLNGVTLKGLMQVASQMKLACRPLRFELNELQHLNLPAILHWDMNHFVVLKAATNKKVVIHDPAAGIKDYSLAEATKHLTGIALELSPAKGFAPKNEKGRLPFRAFWGQMPELTSSLAQIFILSVILELLVIAAPFYMQLTVDEVITRGDSRFWPAHGHQRCHGRAPLLYRSRRAKRGAVPNRRAPVPPFDSAAAELFRKAAHW